MKKCLLGNNQRNKEHDILQINTRNGQKRQNIDTKWDH